MNRFLEILTVALAALHLVACQSGDSPRVGDVDGSVCQVDVPQGDLYDEVFLKITSGSNAGGESAVPVYRSWPLFPGTGPLKRLGLPVHGRWTTVYADPVYAAPFIERALDGNPDLPLELPAGSILVKENYRSSQDATTITSDQSTLEVLTVMYKPSPGESAPEESLYPFPCATATLEPYNGDPETGCLGGRWFWAFYKIQPDDPTICDTSDFGKFENTSVNKAIGSFCVNCHAPAFGTDYIRILHDELDPFTVDPGPAPSVPTASAPSCSVALSPDAPADVPVNPLSVWLGPDGPDGARSMVDCFSWQTFVALNWPADPDQRGEPDRNRSILDVHGASDGLTVWQTYFPVYELFQPGNVSYQPPPFNEPVLPDAPGCSEAAGSMLVTLGAKSRDIPNETGQAFAGTFGDLRDRNKNLVWYEVLINETEYDYIVENGLFETAGLTPAGPAGFDVDLPYNATINEPSVEIKSAWKILCTEDSCQPVDDPKAYLVSDAYIYEGPDKGCVGPEQLGLIGLHVAVRSFWAPQWIWATFEHEANTPLAGSSETTEDTFSFWDPTVVEPADCFKEPFLISDPACANVLLNRFPGAPPNLPAPDHPNQISRLVPFDKETEALNRKFRAALPGTPFQNYRLVNAQWPLNGQAGTPDQPRPHSKACSGNTLGDNCYQVVPEILRNAVVESFMTTFETIDGENVQTSNRSCLECHVSLGPTGSYVWLDGAANRVPVSP